VFDKLFVAMVRSGEQSGRLEDALDRVAFQVEKRDALRRQVKSAMMYPALVFGVAIVVLLAVVTFIIPVFVGIFEEIGEEHPGEDTALPLPTQICVMASDAITGYWFVILPILVFSFFAFFRWKKTEKGKEAWDKFLLRIPFKIGDVIQKVALARWSRTFSGAVSAGVPMLQAIKLTGETAGNVVVEQAMEDVYSSVKRGGSLAGPIEGNDIFPPMVGHMVAVGEETGQLEHMLSKIADFYEAEVDAKVKALTALIEPLMIAFVGGVVGFIVIAMYLPIFSLYDKIR
jgi:type IV pilus assembly protein PilC